MAYRRDIADTDYALGAVMGAGLPGPAEDTGQNRTTMHDQLVAGRPTGPGRGNARTSGIPGARPKYPKRARMPPSLAALFPPTKTPRTSAMSAHGHARTEVPRPGVTADQIARAHLEADKSDLHAVMRQSRLVIDATLPLAKRVTNAHKRARTVADTLAALGDSFTTASLQREAALFDRQCQTILPTVPDIAERIPKPGPDLRLSLIAAHRALREALEAPFQALRREVERQGHWKRRGAPTLTPEQRAEAREKIASTPSLWKIARAGPYAVDEALRPPARTVNACKVKPAAPIRHGDPYAADVSDLLPQKLTDAEVEARFDLATWLQHGTCDLTRTRLDPPSNLFPLARLICAVDPAHPEALDVVAAVLHCAHDRDDERDQPGFRTALGFLMIGYAWDHPEFAHLKTTRERAVALAACWNAELDRSAEPDAVARLTAWRRTRTAAASNAYSLARIGEAHARLARMRAWLGRASRDASARAALAKAGLIEAYACTSQLRTT